jgi:multisubunit Na+/H+ antiporter MnhB subunit
MNSPTTDPETTRAEQVHSQRASIAVGVAPILMLLGFTLVIGGVIEPDIGVAVFAACAAWVVYEMHRYQQVIGRDEDATGPRHPR